MADPITPNTPNVDGQVITMFMDFTSGGAGSEDDVSLPTYAPKIDLRIGHPVLSGMLWTSEVAGAGDGSTDSLNLKPENEMARGIAADTEGEWRIKDKDTIAIYQTEDQNGIVALTYIAFGSQQA